jgi:hypothetical protein
MNFIDSIYYLILHKKESILAGVKINQNGNLINNKGIKVENNKHFFTNSLSNSIISPAATIINIRKISNLQHLFPAADFELMLLFLVSTGIFFGLFALTSFHTYLCKYYIILLFTLFIIF